MTDKQKLIIRLKSAHDYFAKYKDTPRQWEVLDKATKLLDECEVAGINRTWALMLIKTGSVKEATASQDIVQCPNCNNFFKNDETIINHGKWCKERGGGKT